MFICNHCKKEFSCEPYVSSNNKRYCSFECVPESGIDQPYSFEYFNFVDAINNIKDQIDKINLLEDRIDLENELEELYHDYFVLTYGDDEGLFYKRQIQKTLSSLGNLYEDINNIFMTRKIVLRPAAVIYWYNLQNIIGKELTKLILNNFIEEMSPYYEGWFENLCCDMSSSRIGGDTDKLCVSTFNDAREIRRVFYKCLIANKKLMTKEQRVLLSEESLCIGVKEICHCDNCGFWELWEDFRLNKELNIYKCGTC